MLLFKSYTQTPNITQNTYCITVHGQKKTFVIAIEFIMGKYRMAPNFRGIKFSI